MFPFIPSGSELSVRPFDGGALRVGDVVAFVDGGGLTAHRVVAIEGQADGRVLSLRGDAQARSERVPVHAIACVVEAVQRHGVRYRLDGPVGRLARAVALTRGRPMRWIGALVHAGARLRRGLR